MFLYCTYILHTSSNNIYQQHEYPTKTVTPIVEREYLHAYVCLITTIVFNKLDLSPAKSNLNRYKSRKLIYPWIKNGIAICSFSLFSSSSIKSTISVT